MLWLKLNHVSKRGYCANCFSPITAVNYFTHKARKSICSSSHNSSASLIIWVCLPCNMMTSWNGNIFRVTGHLCPHKGQWRGLLMFSLICVWINGWVNNREAGDLRRYRAHYNINIMSYSMNYHTRFLFGIFCFLAIIYALCILKLWGYPDIILKTTHSF